MPATLPLPCDPDRTSDRSDIDEIIAAFGGDAHAAIAAMLDDIDALCWQIDRAALYTSRGLTRGWQPSWQRAIAAERAQ